MVNEWRRIADAVPDPELPFVTLGDLGIVREVSELNGQPKVVLTPTYTGCPATKEIKQSVIDAFARAELDVHVEHRNEPAWNTDWITQEGRQKLLLNGISPPPSSFALTPDFKPECPQCGSSNNEELSRFGSTPCKSMYRCLDCLEPFDFFKCLKP